MQMLKFRNLLKLRPPSFASSSFVPQATKKTFASFQNQNPDQDETPVFVMGDNFSPPPEKPFESKQPFYLAFPIKSPLFPQSTYFTKLSTAQQELLTKMKVKYVTAFLSKEAANKDPKSSDSELEIDLDAAVTPEPNNGKEGKGPGKKDRYKRFREAAQLSYYNPEMSNIIIYDENLSLNYGQELIQVEENGQIEVQENDQAFQIPKLSSIDDIYQLGTLCKLRIQKVPSESPNKVDESFAVLQSLSRVRIKEEVTSHEDIIKQVLTKPPKQPQRAKANKQNRGGFSFFKPDSLFGGGGQQSPTQPVEEEEANNKVTEIPPEVIKYQNDVLDNFKFVKVEHYETPNQIPEAEFSQDYQSKMLSLLDFYWKLRNKVQVNVPELPLLPEEPKALDLVCGFLSATTLFGKKDLQHLLQTVPLPMRLDLCLKYIMKYEKEFNLQWDALEKESSLPMDPNSAKQQFQEIYNFLKRSSENPFKKPIVEKIKENMANKKFPPEILKMIEEELSRFSELNESHPDYNVQRNFLELITALPFGVKSPDNFDIAHARKILDEDHYGLDEVKNRILEFIAVAKLKGSIRGKSLLLVGPPGVGKTSIGSSIARCLNRKFVRIALGGEHDVSVLKGHRKTYIGAYPGRLVQALKTADAENPVIMLDEIDKISSGMRGNLQDTLLEILDPVQNVKFTDHFLDTPIDLSNALFVCTANLTETIHPAVLDRMEVIHLSGYTKDEKKQILTRYLQPRALEASGLKEKYADKINMTDEAIDTLLVRYAREAGVRNLERLMKRICEKVTLKFVKGDNSNITITPDNLKDFVGLPIFSDQRLYKNIPPAGVILGLGYNSYGGSVLFIETMRSNFDAHLIQIPKKAENSSFDNTNGTNGGGQAAARRGHIKLTGSLGDVMQESTQIAYSYARYILSNFFNNTFLETNDVHIHFPDGASKKDGPSAGVAITSSLVSLALNTPTADVVAMTGEISLTGKVLKIGGVKEKILAAKREGVKKVILPLDNKPDVDELKDYIKEGLEFHFVDNYLQAMNILFPSLVKDKPAFHQAHKTPEAQVGL